MYMKCHVHVHVCDADVVPHNQGNITYCPVEVLVDVEGHGGVEGDEELVLDGDDSRLDGAVTHPPLLPQRDACTRHTRNVRTDVCLLSTSAKAQFLYVRIFGTRLHYPT